MDSILESIIKRKLLSQSNVESYIITPIVVTVDKPNFLMYLGNDFLFHISSEMPSAPEYRSFKLSCSDNYIIHTKLNYSQLNMTKYACFRDYLEIDTD